MKGGYKGDGNSLFTGSHVEKTRENLYRLFLGRFSMATRGQLFTMRKSAVGSGAFPKFGHFRIHQDILPRQRFYLERLDQVSLDVLPTWNSLVLLVQEKDVTSSHQSWPVTRGWSCSHQCHIPASVWVLTSPSKTRGRLCWGFLPVSFSQLTQSLS